MTRILAAFVVIAGVVGPIATAAQTAPDFSGTWTLDIERSAATGGGGGAGAGNPTGGQGGGLGLGPAATELKITQTASALTIDERRGDTTTRLVYALTGATSSNKIPAGRSAGQSVTSTSTWANGTLMTKYAIVPPGDGAEAVRYQESRSIDRNGALVVETTMAGQPNLRRSVYVKKPILPAP